MSTSQSNKKPPLLLYDRSAAHDVLIANWWRELCETGELADVFNDASGALSSFYTMFQPPRALLFACDGLGIFLAMWFEPVMQGAFCSLWIRRDRRHGPTCYRLLCEAYDLALERWPVLVGVTRQERLLQAHRRLGYIVVGQVPHIWGGNPAWVVALTKETWWTRRAR